MRQNSLFLFAVFALLFINAGDLHQHLCLDGQEPTLSYHFETLDGHPDHDDSEVHNDYESEESIAALKVKSSNASQQYFLSSNVLLHIELQFSYRFISIPADDFSIDEVVTSLPPQRAPPQTV